MKKGRHTLGGNRCSGLLGGLGLRLLRAISVSIDGAESERGGGGLSLIKRNEYNKKKGKYGERYNGAEGQEELR